MTQSILVGIAGGSASGKTTLAQSVTAALGEDRTGLLFFDDYYRDITWRNSEEIRRHDFDRLEAFELDLFCDHLGRLRSGQAIEVPRYDFGTHRRRRRTRHLEPHPVTLVDGLLLFVDPAVRELLDLKIFVDTPADIRLARRILRDTRDRHRDVRDIIRQYLGTVRRANDELIDPSKQYADLIVEGIGDYERETEEIVGRLRDLTTP